jgi:hypothetical protein
MNSIVYTPPQLVKFTGLLEQKGVDHNMFQSGLATGITADFAEALATVDLTALDREAFRKAIGLNRLVPDPIILTVDYSKSLEQMIEAGSYDWKNDSLTAKNFPVKGEGIVEYEARMFHSNRSISSEDAIALIKKEDEQNPWEPAQTEHLLAFGAAYPDEQRKYPIIALGSVGEFDGHRYVPYLCGGGSERLLNLYWFDGGWSSFDRFLAVRKKVS